LPAGFGDGNDPYDDDPPESHKHEWTVHWLMKHPDNDNKEIPFRCECGERLTWTEIERRVNAAESDA
jgi:hypothetical protein